MTSDAVVSTGSAVVVIAIYIKYVVVLVVVYIVSTVVVVVYLTDLRGVVICMVATLSGETPYSKATSRRSLFCNDFFTFFIVLRPTIRLFTFSFKLRHVMGALIMT